MLFLMIFCCHYSRFCKTCNIEIRYKNYITALFFMRLRSLIYKQDGLTSMIAQNEIRTLYSHIYQRQGSISTPELITY